MSALTVSTDVLTPSMIDFAVAQALDLSFTYHNGNVFLAPTHEAIAGDSMRLWAPSRIWRQAGPIIDRERIHLCPIIFNNQPAWQSWVDGVSAYRFHDAYALAAAMKAFVQCRLGDAVELPNWNGRYEYSSTGAKA